MDLIEKQKLLDTQIEPASLTFQIDGLVPTNSLKIRMEAFDIVAPYFFFSGSKLLRLLDVGCAKGYFSLLFAKNGGKVLGIDYNFKAIDLCRILSGNSRANFKCVSFRNLPLRDIYYDRIFIGNGPHYLFVDSGGNWDWLDKLAVLSTDLVLMEGGFNFEDPQMKDLVVVGKEEFNWECFSNKVQEFFEIQQKVVSPIPGRYIVLLKKKQNISPFKEVQLYDLPIDCALRFGWNRHSSLFLTHLEDKILFAKLYPIDCHWQTMQLASLCKNNTDIECFIKSGDKYIGCCENYLYPENWDFVEKYKELIKVFCEQQIYLSRQGHIDIDIAFGNCLISKSGDIKIVDKNQIYCISSSVSSFDERHIHTWFNILVDSHIISLGSIEEMKKAIISNDSKRIELAFQNILDQL